MGATGSIGKQETSAVERTVNLLNTADNFVHRVHMNEAYMAIMQAGGKLQSQWKQSMEMRSHSLIPLPCKNRTLGLSCDLSFVGSLT